MKKVICVQRGNFYFALFQMIWTYRRIFTSIFLPLIECSQQTQHCGVCQLGMIMGNVAWCRMIQVDKHFSGLFHYKLEKTVSTGLDKQKFQHLIVNIFLPITFSICFGCSKEPSH